MIIVIVVVSVRFRVEGQQRRNESTTYSISFNVHLQTSRNMP